MIPDTGLEMQQNLLTRCKVCHPDASTNFPLPGCRITSHPLNITRLVYYVNLFYKFFIPITLGGMALLVVMDASRTLINRTRKRRKTARLAEEAAARAEPVKADEIPVVTEAALTETPVTPQPEEAEEPAALPPAETEQAESTAAEPDVSDEEPETKPEAPDQPAPEPPADTKSSDSEVEHG